MIYEGDITMPGVKSLDDLKKLRDEALQKRAVNTASGKVQVIVSMGTCGIAVGARDAMKAILDTIESDKLCDVSVTQTGCIGLCEREPIVQVVIGDQPKVTYGKVTPEIARRILREHVVNGKIIQDNIIPLNNIYY
jgi:NADP-reducing hydrogenase subunit HndB